MKIIKKRLLRKSNRGIYLQDKELINTNFTIGEGFKYLLDIKNKKIIIVPSFNDKCKNTVSKRKIKDTVKPVIDIRNKKALEIFKDSNYLEVTILKDKIVIKKIENCNSDTKNSFSTKLKKQFTKVVNIVSLIKNKNNVNEIILSKDNIQKVCGFEQIDLFSSILESNNAINHITASPGYTISKVINKIKESKIPLKIVSLFSGCGLMDKAFIDEGFEIVYALEKDKFACETYKHNINNNIHCKNILETNLSSLPKAPIIIGGIPCVSFSNANRKNNLCYLNNPKNILVEKYIETIEQNQNCKLFVIENVPQLLTCGKGKFIKEIKERLKDFTITTKIINAVNYGAAQMRERAIIIGSKIGAINLPDKLVDKFKTVKEAFTGLTASIPNQNDYSKAKPSTLERMKYVPIGGNVFDIPENIRPKGQHSDIYKRLDTNSPSITIVNPRKAMLLHPYLNRILSIRECARIQGIPDDFIFKGSLSAMQQGVANGVPYEISKVVAQYLKKAINNFNKIAKIY